MIEARRRLRGAAAFLVLPVSIAALAIDCAAAPPTVVWPDAIVRLGGGHRDRRCAGRCTRRRCACLSVAIRRLRAPARRGHGERNAGALPREPPRFEVWERSGMLLDPVTNPGDGQTRSSSVITDPCWRARLRDDGSRARGDVHVGENRRASRWTSTRERVAGRGDDHQTRLIFGRDRHVERPPVSRGLPHCSGGAGGRARRDDPRGQRVVGRHGCVHGRAISVGTSRGGCL